MQHKDTTKALAINEGFFLLGGVMSENVSSTGGVDVGAFDGQRWGSVPISAFSIDAGLEARCLFALLWTYVHANSEYFAWPSQKTLASQLGVSTRTVRTYIKELVDKGYLTRSFRREIDPEWTGHPLARIYKLLLPTIVAEGSLPIGRPSSGKSGRPASGKGGRPSSTEQIKEQTTEQNSVVDSQELESLILLASKTPGIKNPAGWAISMQRKGLTAKDVVAQKMRKHKGESEEDRQDAFRRSFEEVNDE